MRLPFDMTGDCTMFTMDIDVSNFIPEDLPFCSIPTFTTPTFVPREPEILSPDIMIPDIHDKYSFFPGITCLDLSMMGDGIIYEGDEFTAQFNVDHIALACPEEGTPDICEFNYNFDIQVPKVPGKCYDLYDIVSEYDDNDNLTFGFKVAPKCTVKVDSTEIEVDVDEANGLKWDEDGAYCYKEGAEKSQAVYIKVTLCSVDSDDPKADIYSEDVDDTDNIFPDGTPSEIIIPLWYIPVTTGICKDKIEDMRDFSSADWLDIPGGGYFNLSEVTADSFYMLGPMPALCDGAVPAIPVVIIDDEQITVAPGAFTWETIKSNLSRWKHEGGGGVAYLQTTRGVGASATLRFAASMPVSPNNFSLWDIPELDIVDKPNIQDRRASLQITYPRFVCSGAAFGYSVESDNEIVISPGELLMPNGDSWVSEKTTVTLSGNSPTFIYATHPIDNSSGITVSAISTDNLDDVADYGTLEVFPLYEFKYDGDTEKWSLERNYLGGQAIDHSIPCMPFDLNSTADINIVNTMDPAINLSLTKPSGTCAISMNLDMDIPRMPFEVTGTAIIREGAPLSLNFDIDRVAGAGDDHLSYCMDIQIPPGGTGLTGPAGELPSCYMPFDLTHDISINVTDIEVPTADLSFTKVSGTCAIGLDLDMDIPCMPFDLDAAATISIVDTVAPYINLELAKPIGTCAIDMDLDIDLPQSTIEGAASVSIPGMIEIIYDSADDYKLKYRTRGAHVLNGVLHIDAFGDWILLAETDECAT